MEINKLPISYLTSTKHITRDMIIKEGDKGYTSGTIIVSENKLLIVKGTLICL